MRGVVAGVTGTPRALATQSYSAMSMAEMAPVRILPPSKYWLRYLHEQDRRHHLPVSLKRPGALPGGGQGAM